MRISLSGHYGYKRLLTTMLPMMGMMIVISVYSIVDGFFVSNYAGSDAFASMNIIWPGISIIAAIGLMIGGGGSALISKTLGEGNPGRARRIFTMLVTLCLILGAVFGFVIYFFMEPICHALGADELLIANSILYGRIVIVAIPFFILQMAFQTFYMVAEKPQLGTIMSVVCGCVNIVLDYVFVVVFGWGLRGAAIATVISLVTGGVFPLIYFQKKRGNIYFVPFHFRSVVLIKTCTNGMSEFIGNIALNVVSIFYNIQLMKYIGPDGVSAYGIIMYVGFIFGAIFIGYNMGVAQLIAYNYGAKDHKEMTSLIQKSLVLITIGGVFLTTLAQLTAPWLSKAFFSYSESLCSLATRALRIYMLSFLLCGYGMFTSALFTALNNGIVSAVAAFARTLVFELACIFILPLIFGTDGIWMAVCAAEVFAIFLCVYLILHYRKRYGIGKFWRRGYID